MIRQLADHFSGQSDSGGGQSLINVKWRREVAFFYAYQGPGPTRNSGVTYSLIVIFD
jgi:hypothetical protein